MVCVTLKRFPRCIICYHHYLSSFKQVAGLIGELGYSNTLPSRQLFAMFNYGGQSNLISLEEHLGSLFIAEDFHTRPALVAATVRAVFALLWNVPLDPYVKEEAITRARAKLQVSVSRELTTHSAIVNVSVSHFS